MDYDVTILNEWLNKINLQIAVHFFFISLFLLILLFAEFIT